MENPRYEMIVWWSDEDKAFIVDVPELPGCMAHGHTRAEGIANAEEAVSFWLQTAKEDGIAIPEPKGRLVSLKFPGRSRRSLANGATWMSDIHGNAARVAESEAGAERMNATNSSPFLLRF